jgi:hypothetical protein
MDELIVDLGSDFLDATGIYVRAKYAEKWDSFDIGALTCESLKAWLRSRGGENVFAKRAVAMLLGHPSSDIDASWPV